MLYRRFFFVSLIIGIFASCQQRVENLDANKDFSAKSRDSIQNNICKTKALTFDWNGDGIPDTILLNGIAASKNDTSWEQTVFKLSGHKQLAIGNLASDFTFVDAADLIKNREIAKLNKDKSNLLVRISLDKNPKDDNIFIKGMPGFDEGKLYIIALNKNGNPCIAYHEVQQAENISFYNPVNYRGTEIVLPSSEELTLDEFKWDSIANGVVPDWYTSVKNKKGEMVEIYNPLLSYKFNGDSLVVDTLASREYNIDHGKPWAGVDPKSNLVIFYKAAGSKPEIRKREEMIKIWNRE